MENENMLIEMQVEFRELKLEVYESRNLVVKLQTELSQSQAKVVKLENVVLDNKTQIVRVEEDLSNIKTRTSTLQEDMGDNKARIATLQEDMGDNKARIATLQEDMGNNKARIATLQEDMGNNKARIATLQEDMGDNKARIATLQEDMGDNKARIVTLQEDMSNRRVRIDNVEDEIASNKEKILNIEQDLNNSKSKIVKLEQRQIENERRTKSLVKDISTQVAVVDGKGDSLLTVIEAEKLKKRVKAVKKKCDELSKGYEQLRKLQLILNEFILNAQKSSLQTGSQVGKKNQTPQTESQPATLGAEGLQSQLEDDQESQHLPAEIEATLPDPEDSLQVAFSKCKLLVRDRRIGLTELNSSEPILLHRRLAALELLAGEDDGPSWNIGSRFDKDFKEGVDKKVEELKKLLVRTSSKAKFEYIRICKDQFLPDGSKIFFSIEEVPELGGNYIFMTISKSRVLFSKFYYIRKTWRNDMRQLNMDDIKECHLEDSGWLLMELKDGQTYQIKSVERQEIFDTFKMCKQI